MGSIKGEEDEYAFTFEKENLNAVLKQVPIGWKVGVVSVVGAFRTGKSFLLSLFVRYLTDLSKYEENNDIKWYNKFSSIGQDSGFHWRGGSERDTTGIWMWSHPFCLKRDNGEMLAVLLIDTQGMFDHETTMAVTASIFGLSTLISSYQIFNIDKRIQEDHLQQLALFSEYGRIAIKEEQKQKGEDTSTNKKPFQQIEFLVRDWQNFECDGEGELPNLEQEMEDYLQTCIEERAAKDLYETREQISSCFESMSCFLLTHPGRDVTKKKYTGQIDLIDPVFLRLLDRFCQRVFDNLQPKKVHGREITVAELYLYIETYANLFQSGAKFPEAGTLLEATATANNVNAVNTSFDIYKEGMDLIAGVNVTKLLQQDQLEESSQRLTDESVLQFDDIANFGPVSAIKSSKDKLFNDIEKRYDLYVKLNEGRNPFLGLETVIIPGLISLVSYILRKIADMTCTSWSQTCKASSDILSEISTVVLLFMLIVFLTKAKEFSLLLQKIKKIYHTLFGGSVNKQD